MDTERFWNEELSRLNTDFFVPPSTEGSGGLGGQKVAVMHPRVRQ